MKKNIFILVILILNSCAFSQEENSKIINKTFEVSALDKLEIENSYGEIQIETWDKNIIEIEVQISVKDKNKKKIQARLDGITIDFSQTNGTVFAKTKTLNSGWGKGSMEIYYKVKMPKSNRLKLKNEYGDIRLAEHTSVVEIDLDYGSISSSFKIKNLTLKLNYGDADLQVVENFSTNSNYSQIETQNMENATIKCDYCDLRLGYISNVAQVNMDYGKLKLMQMDHTFTSINFKGDYNDIRFELSKNIKVNYDFKGDYSSFKVPNEEVSEPGPDNNFETKLKTNYQSTSKISIRSDYTNVKINEN